MRRRLLTAVSLSVLAAAPAFADEEVTDERTTQIRTSDADGQGNADNIVITSSGRVTLDNPGPAVVLDSDNDVTINSGGQINVEEVDGATGVQILGGNEGDFTHGGAINLGDDFTPEDSETDNLEDRDGDGTDDPDGEADGPFSDEFNKTGVLIGEVDGNFDAVAGQSPFTGDIVAESGSSITVEGQDSFGVRTVTAVDGDIRLGGTISLTGENSRGLSIEDGVTGDVELTGRISLS